jgi:membrane-associated protease RseP (regulator of RpoE activity)
MINLLPIGQLDGGHVAVAYFGNGYNRFARALHAVLPLVAVAVFFWTLRVLEIEALAMRTPWDRTTGLWMALGAASPWLVWYVLVRVLRRAGGGANHPPVDEQPLPPSRRALFWLMALVFIGIFMPVPVRQTYTPPEPAAASPSDTHATLP